MYHTNRFVTDEITDPVAIIHRPSGESATSRTCPASPGLRRGVCVSLVYLRCNRFQQELAESLDTSQPTISRAIGAITPLIGAALGAWIPR